MTIMVAMMIMAATMRRNGDYNDDDDDDVFVGDDTDDDVDDDGQIWGIAKQKVEDRGTKLESRDKRSWIIGRTMLGRREKKSGGKEAKSEH